MTDIDRIADTASQGIAATLKRLTSLAGSVVVLASLVAGATFATGWWVFDGSTGWLLVGGAICLVPVSAALVAWFFVSRTVHAAPLLLADLRSFLETSACTVGTLIDHDSGIALGMQAKGFRALRTELNERRRDFPALFAGVRAITSVPGLAAISALGIIAIGGFGAILLIVGLIG